MKPLQEGSESNGSSIVLHDETARSHVAPETPLSMTNNKIAVLVGLMSVAIIVVLPLCVMNHIKLQTQGEWRILTFASIVTFLYFSEVACVGLNNTLTDIIEKVGGIDNLVLAISSRLGVVENRPVPSGPKGSKGDVGAMGTGVLDSSKCFPNDTETNLFDYITGSQGSSRRPWGSRYAWITRIAGIRRSAWCTRTKGRQGRSGRAREGSLLRRLQQRHNRKDPRCRGLVQPDF